MKAEFITETWMASQDGTYMQLVHRLGEGREYSGGWTSLHEMQGTLRSRRGKWFVSLLPNGIVCKCSHGIQRVMLNVAR